jgi:ketosteroid isomerase-like protein
MLLVEPTEVTEGLWAALYDRDWDRIAGCFDASSIYYDVPTTPAAAAKGPADIVRRLRYGLEKLTSYVHAPGRTVIAQGDVVMTEHTELWTFPSGEKVSLPFVSVQHVRGDVIALWRDYWDLGVLRTAPAGWQQELAQGDLSWVYDATVEMAAFDAARPD